MDIFNRIDQLTGSLETTIKGVALVIGFIVVGSTLNWFRTITLSRVVLAVFIAALVIVVVRKPDLLADDVEKTVALPAVQQAPGLHADAINLDAGHVAATSVTSLAGARL